MKTVIFALAVLSLSISSCKKDKDVPEVRKNLLVKQTYFENGAPSIVYTYGYDANNRMTSFAFTGNASNTPRNYSYTYNAAGALTEAFESQSSLKTRYSYNATGTVSDLKEYQVSGATETLVYTYIYSYAGGIISENLVYALPANAFRNEYKYDVKGNLAEIKSYTTTVANPAGTYSSTLTFSNYDSKHSPRESFPAAMVFTYTAINNPGTLVYPSFTINYTYEYNADGYPTKRIDGTNSDTYEYRRL